jgi:hypothetical protein
MDMGVSESNLSVVQYGSGRETRKYKKAPSSLAGLLRG